MAIRLTCGSPFPHGRGGQGVRSVLAGRLCYTGRDQGTGQRIRQRHRIRTAQSSCRARRARLDGVSCTHAKRRAVPTLPQIEAHRGKYTYSTILRAEAGR